MDAFERVIEQLLRRQGYWTATSYKVELTRDDKAVIKKPSSPRWEIDIVAFKAAKNEVLAIECKSFFDSRGVMFVDGRLDPEERYKLFSDDALREVVLNRLAEQLLQRGACETRPKPVLALAAGKLACVLFLWYSLHRSDPVRVVRPGGRWRWTRVRRPS